MPFVAQAEMLPQLQAEAKQSGNSPAGQAPDIHDPCQVTVALRNIACKYTQEDVKRYLDESGLQGKFSLVYVPRIESRNSNFGYGFVRFRNAAYAAECAERLNGKILGASRTAKLCQVEIANLQESIEATLSRRRRKQNGVKPEVLLCNDPIPGEAPAATSPECAPASSEALLGPTVPLGSSAGPVDAVFVGSELPPRARPPAESPAPPARQANTARRVPPPPGLEAFSAVPPRTAPAPLASPPSASMAPVAWQALQVSLAKHLAEALEMQMKAGAGGVGPAPAKLAGGAPDRFSRLPEAPMSYLTEPRYVQVASF